MYSTRCEDHRHKRNTVAEPQISAQAGSHQRSYLRISTPSFTNSSLSALLLVHFSNLPHSKGAVDCARITASSTLDAIHRDSTHYTVTPFLSPSAFSVSPAWESSAGRPTYTGYTSSASTRALC
ncbi:hypothetical protein A0H81_12795 [Grifola frondosa]|uniref:Uncharacterized protein n=1 Tax=Grifola frondosa TaxID=5627 RepID=A0A1C7LQJ4_GRIFR|nr:hypothetical protein A0H81_12795 [Grifola frondosa]